MNTRRAVYILVLSGSQELAEQIANAMYSGSEVVFVSKRALREGTWARQLSVLRDLKGEALLIFAESLAEIQELLLLKLTIVFHRCKYTIIADSSGIHQILSRRSKWWLLPQALAAAAADACVLTVSWIALMLLRLGASPRQNFEKNTALGLAALYPFHGGRMQDGGAMTHVTGFLSGLAACSAHCDVYSGQAILNTPFPVHLINYARRFYLFRESLALSYNWHFAAEVEKQLDGRIPVFFYQRHGRYTVAGALLSRKCKRPLVLEYNGSETWIAEHWDPTKFLPWLRLCEEISLRSATLITVVSEVLREELITRGVPKNKIIVNPNAVDADMFRPHCGGDQIRSTLGIKPAQITVGFIGSFSYWHGIEVLQGAIQLLLEEQLQGDTKLSELRFLLIGDGPLNPEIRNALRTHREQRSVIFTGSIPHAQAPQYLDAADILVSPHVPMSDGTPFFGSPTKIFEYMAMGKAIVASELDQLARVLNHQQTAWLVEPGNPTELASAIRLLAARPQIRQYIGANARNTALSQHTWQQNAARVLSRFAEVERSSTQLSHTRA